MNMTFPAFLFTALFLTAVIVLPLLKLFSIITWSWWFVFAPVELFVVGIFVFVVGVMLFAKPGDFP